MTPAFHNPAKKIFDVWKNARKKHPSGINQMPDGRNPPKETTELSEASEDFSRIFRHNRACYDAVHLYMSVQW